MMQKPKIPLSLIRDLRCRQCQNFVSCGPVYVVPDESILCGRCKHLAKDVYRNTAYEALASIFMYPCYNWEDHCSSLLHWNESLQHEEECTYNGCCKFFWHHPRSYCRGPREIPNGDVRLTTVPENLLEHIKCVLCECYLTCDPIYIKPNGKNICHRCVHANGIPPNCLRNLAYERLSTILVFPCIYRNRGCPTRLKFGKSLWQHEAECSYGQIFKKVVKPINQKERGVIKTHSGHYYGTITPNVVLFAPPKEKSDFEVNKELIKSLKRQQERRFLRADEISTHMERFNSEDGSINTEEKNSFHSSSSDRSSPSRLDENDNKSKSNNYPFSPPPMEIGYFSNYKNKPLQTNPDNYQQNLFIAQVHQEDYPSPRISRNNSYNRNFSVPNGNVKNDDVKQSFRKPLHSIDNNLLAGHYPIFMYPRSSGVPKGYSSFNGGTPKTADSNSVPKSPSFNDLPSTPSYPNGNFPQSPYNGGMPLSPTYNASIPPTPFNADELHRTESINSNKELIEELKVKLMKNNTMKSANVAKDSPYKECNNLEEILQVHDKIQ